MSEHASIGYCNISKLHTPGGAGGSWQRQVITYRLGLDIYVFYSLLRPWS